MCLITDACPMLWALTNNAVGCFVVAGMGGPLSYPYPEGFEVQLFT